MGGEKNSSVSIKRAFLVKEMVSLSARDLKGLPPIGLLPRILLTPAQWRKVQRTRNLHSKSSKQPGTDPGFQVGYVLSKCLC